MDLPSDQSTPDLPTSDTSKPDLKGPDLVARDLGHDGTRLDCRDIDNWELQRALRVKHLRAKLRWQ
jgi:hypothetical protein